MGGADLYSYVNVLTKAADASWLRNEVISNNLANVSTPTYKRSDVDFERVLKNEIGRSRYETMDQKIKKVSLTNLSNVHAYVDDAAFSYRLDGNNVDEDTENTELAANQIKYQGLTDSIKHHFTQIKAVIK